MRRLVLASIILALAAALTAASASAEPKPEFKLGFAALAEQIPDVVGEPLENEHHNPANGDSLQQTTRGLMVWRKADNWTAFTDGYRTWVRGPGGQVYERLNTERFDWEPKPQPRLAWPDPTVIQGTDVESSTVWVMGEIRNEGDAPAYEISVSARLLSQSGDVVGSGETSVSYLGPGDTTAYRVTIKGVGAYASAKVSAEGKDSSYRGYDRLAVSNGALEKLVDEYGGDIFTFTGTATNQTGASLKFCKVDVWFLDAGGNIVWADETFTNPGDLAAGASGSFKERTYAQRFNPRIGSIAQVRTYGWAVR